MTHGNLVRESIGLLPRWGLLSLLVLAHACASSQPSWVNEPYREYSKERYVVAVEAGAPSMPPVRMP